MANGSDSAVNSVLAGGEEDENPIPGAQEDTDSGPGGAVGPTGGAGAPISTPPIAPAPSPIQVDSGQKVHPHMAILAGLLKGILGGIQNAPGNPRNAFDRGFMNASPNQQAMQSAVLSKAKSESDLARTQASMAQLQLLHAQHMGERLPQDEQDKLIQMSNDYYKYLTDKEGVEVSATGDIKGAKQLASFKNGNDPNAKAGLGVYQPLIHRDEEGKVVASVVWLPHQDVLQKDQDLGPNPNFDPDQPESEQNPKRLIVHAGIPTKGVAEFAKIANTMAQKATKDQAGELARLNKLPEDNPNQIQAKKDQLQQWLDNDSNDSVFKRQNQDDVQKTVDRLGPAMTAAQGRAEKLADKAAARIEVRQEHAEERKHDYDPVYAKDEVGNLVATNRKTATAQGYSDIDDTVSKADVKSDRDAAPLIRDIRGKLQDYQSEIKKGDLSAAEAMEVRGIMALSDSEFELKLAPFDIGVGVKPAVKQMQEMFRGYNINHLSDKAQDRLATYIAARSSALELQKAQTKSARASKEGLLLDLAQLPNPGIDGRMANKQLDLLMKSVDRISAENPFAEDKTAKFLRKLAGRPSSE